LITDNNHTSHLVPSPLCVIMREKESKAGCKFMHQRIQP